MIVGVTGHRFYDSATARYLTERVDTLLVAWAAESEVRVVTSLAEGADQLVARVAVARGLPIDVVLPADGYRESLEPEFRGEYDRLLAAAATVSLLDHAEPESEAYLDAGLVVLDRADALIAIWDGEPARGTGGTGDIVAAARARGVRVEVLWPDGLRRVEGA